MYRGLASSKHLDLYVNEFPGPAQHQAMDTVDQIRAVVRVLVGKRLQFKDLVG